MNWSSKEFIWLDWAVLVIGILGVAWAVWRAVRKDKLAMQGADSQDYLFGKGEPWYVIGAAIFAANIGSEHLVGLAGTGAKDGVGMAHWEMQGWMILILGWLFVPFYQLLNNKMGKIITMPDFLKYRYTQRTGSWLSIITLIAYILTKVSVTAFTGGIFFEYLLGLPFWWGALGLIAITAVFTVLGGMKGVMTMSAIQTPILIIGSFLVLFLGLSALGHGSIVDGWSNMMDYARSAHDGYGINHMFHWDEGDPMYPKFPGFAVFIGASIIGFWYWCTDQHIVQRVLGQQKGESDDVVMKRARRGTIAAGYFKLLPVFMFLIPGMVAVALAQDPNSGIVMHRRRICHDGEEHPSCRCERSGNNRFHLCIGYFTCSILQQLCDTVYRRLLQTYASGQERGSLCIRRSCSNGSSSYPRFALAAYHDEHGQPIQLSAGHPVSVGSSHGSSVHIGYLF